MSRKKKDEGQDHDTNMLIRSAVAFGIVVGALVLYRLGVFTFASKLYVDYVISGVTQKKSGSDQANEK